MAKKNTKESSWGEIGKAIGNKMEKECKDDPSKCKPKMCGSGSGGAIYALGFLGALIYYLTTATDLWMGVIGILKALFWPAVLVYELLKFLAV